MLLRVLLVADASGDPDAERLAGGGPVEAAALTNKSGPFGKASLAELPVDPGALLKALNAAYGDGR